MGLYNRLKQSAEEIFHRAEIAADKIVDGTVAKQEEIDRTRQRAKTAGQPIPSDPAGDVFERVMTSTNSLGTRTSLDMFNAHIFGHSTSAGNEERPIELARQKQEYFERLQASKVIAEAGLGDMILGLQVWRKDADSASQSKMYTVPAKNILLRDIWGRQNLMLPASYSFAVLREKFEELMHKDSPTGKYLDIATDGRLCYFPGGGEMLKTVIEQDVFETAFVDLYIRRDSELIALFIFETGGLYKGKGTAKNLAGTDTEISPITATISKASPGYASMFSIGSSVSEEEANVDPLAGITDAGRTLTKSSLPNYGLGLSGVDLGSDLGEAADPIAPGKDIEEPFNESDLEEIPLTPRRPNITEDSLLENNTEVTTNEFLELDGSEGTTSGSAAIQNTIPETLVPQFTAPETATSEILSEFTRSEQADRSPQLLRVPGVPRTPTMSKSSAVLISPKSSAIPKAVPGFYKTLPTPPSTVSARKRDDTNSRVPRFTGIGYPSTPTKGALTPLGENEVLATKASRASRARGVRTLERSEIEGSPSSLGNQWAELTSPQGSLPIATHSIDSQGPASSDPASSPQSSPQVSPQPHKSPLTSIGSRLKTVVKKTSTKRTLAVKQTPEQVRSGFQNSYVEKVVAAYEKTGNVPETKYLVNDEEDLEVDEDITVENWVVSQLQDLTKLQELDQFPEKDITPWKNTCNMFHIDWTKTGLEQRVQIAGLKTALYQYQAFGIYWQMTTSRQGSGGGFVADDMGLGKTLSFLAYMVVERQLEVLWQQVDDSRAKKDGKHHPEPNDLPENFWNVSKEIPEGLTEAEHQAECFIRINECPSKRDGWIACPCEPASETRKLARQPGLRMACVPAGLVANWWDQWKTHVDVTQPELALTIMVDHPGAFELAPVAEMNSKASAPRLITIAKADVKTSRNLEEASVVTAKDRHSGLLLLTTKEQAPKWIGHSAFQVKGRVLDPLQSGKIKSSTIPCLVFGIAMVDECHEDNTRASKVTKMLVDLPVQGLPFIWGYSGTPFRLAPRDLQGILWAIASHRGGVDVRRDLMTDFDDICQRFDKVVALPTKDQAALSGVLNDLKPKLLALMIRRRAENNWFEHTLVPLNNHFHRDVTLAAKTPTVSVDEVSAFEEQSLEEKAAKLARIQKIWDENPEKRTRPDRPTQLTFNGVCLSEWRSRLLATFPFFLKLTKPAADGEFLRLTPEELKGLLGSDAKEKSNLYYKAARNVVTTSPKALFLLELIHLLDKSKDINGNEHKLIVFTSFPQVAFVLKLYLENHYGKKGRVGMLTGNMKLQARDTAIAAFNDTMAPNGKSRVTPLNYQILIGEYRHLGIGQQLTRACNLVLMEPNYDTSKESQAYARIHRIGQKNKVTYSYRLLDASSAVEARIVSRQEQQKFTMGTAVTITEGERSWTSPFVAGKNDLDEENIRAIALHGVVVKKPSEPTVELVG